MSRVGAVKLTPSHPLGEGYSTAENLSALGNPSPARSSRPLPEGEAKDGSLSLRGEAKDGSLSLWERVGVRGAL
jgi:hypothetical protein